jgi:hypothetical protein
MKSWKAVLGYVPGDSLENVRRKTTSRLRSAVAVNNPKMAKEIMLAWRQARESFGKNRPAQPSEANLNAFLSAARAHGRRR